MHAYPQTLNDFNECQDKSESFLWRPPKLLLVFCDECQHEDEILPWRPPEDF
jgi:phage-related protein